MTTQDAAGPLDGVVVLDLSQLAQGPFATQILGDLGAEVLKLEPLHGDWMRRFALCDHYIEGESVSFLAFNRNKRSVAINLKHPDGVQAFLGLVEQVDVLVENFRPGVMDRLGLGYDILAEHNPGLVFCSSTGYGADGPYRSRPGQDLLAQAIAGMPYLNGRVDDPPMPVGMGVADLTAGLHIVYGVLAALLQRHRTGRGQHVEVNLLNSLMALETQELTAHLNGAPLPARHRVAAAAPHVGPPFGIHPTADGHIALAMNPLSRLGPLLDIDEELPESMNAVGDADRIYERLAAALVRRTTDQWLEILLPADVWCASVNDFDAVMSDPQVLHNEMIRPVDHPTVPDLRVIGPAVQFSAAEATLRRPPPLLGEHSREVLSGHLGLTEQQIDDLVASGAVG